MSSAATSGCGRRKRSSAGIALLAVALAVGAVALAARLQPQSSGSPGHTALGTAAALAPNGEVRRAAERGIAAAEYRASWTPRGLQAPNRAHAVRTYFTPSGARIEERSGAGAPLFELALAGIGRGSELEAVGPGTLASDAARVEIRRPEIVEWYENSARGVEHGFTLEQRPPGAGPLALELAVSGARVAARAEGVAFASASGRTFVYDELVVLDARGRALPAHMQVAAADRLRLVVDDSGAAYPVVIDPLLTAVALLESNQVEARLGFSVAGAGDVNNDGYDDVIVGAPLYDSGQSDEGAVFLFHGSPSGIADADPSTATTQLEGDQVRGNFGFSLAAGNVNGDAFSDVIVGANMYNAGQVQEGAVFVFLGSASGIADGNPSTAATQLESNLFDSRLYSPPAITPVVGGAQLGSSVASGDVNNDGFDDVIAGARFYSNPERREGAVFIWHGSASGIADGNPATAQTQLESNVDTPTPQSNPVLFGESVAIAGDVNNDGFDDMIAGARQFNSGQPNEGAAFIFHGRTGGIPSGGVTTATTRLEANQNNANLGVSVASAGDVNGDNFDDVIVGAFGALFQTQPFPAPGRQRETNEGAAFIFLGRTGGIPNSNPTTAATTIDSNQQDARLGWSVAAAGDVNGDLFDDVIIGAPFFQDPTPGDSTNADEGVVFAYTGSASGIARGTPETASFRLEGNQPFANLGDELAGVGDINGDGLDDIALGAQFYSAGQTNEGVVFLLVGVAGSGAGGGSGGSDGADSDADAVPDSSDNCTLVPNISQVDADQDACGNACDADLDNSGSSSTRDLRALGRCLGKSVPVASGPILDPSCAESDLNGDGKVSIADFFLFKAEFDTLPGPGASCNPQ